MKAMINDEYGWGKDNWFTTAQLASLSLPSLPTSKRGLASMAEREFWNNRLSLGDTPLARKRSGRGGGMEYHCSILPLPTLIALGKKTMRIGVIMWALGGITDKKNKLNADANVLLDKSPHLRRQRA